MNKEENNIQAEEKITTSVFFIEANSYETLSLWKEFAKETKWEQDNLGFYQKIGCIDNDENKPIFVSFMFVKIFGKRICFYETTSRYNDSVLVENWIKTNYPVKWDNNSRTAMTNAMNFHHAIDCCKNDI
jgi:hypothetical protein